MRTSLETVKATIRNNLSTIALFIFAFAAIIISNFFPVIANAAPSTETISAAQLTAYTEDSLEMDADEAVGELIELCFDSMNASEEKEEAMLADKEIVRGGYARTEYSVCA